MATQEIAMKAPGWGTLLSGKNGLRSIALAGGVMLHATDVYLATTIMPSVTQEIGGLSLYAWATTVYVIAAIIGSVLSSRHLSQRGPRQAYRIAALLFGIGSLISATAPNMYWLLSGRFVQGLGGGLLFALSYAMISIVFEEKLWPRAMALVSAMWGVSAFSGPFVGGLFAQYGHWRMAFITLVILTTLLLLLTEKVLPVKGPQATSRTPLPAVQLLLLTGATLAVSIGGAIEKTSANIVGVVIAIVLFILLLIAEKRSAHRLLPTGAYRLSGALGATYAVMVLLTIATAVEIYIPYFLQVIHHFTPLKAGYLTVLIAFGWSFSSIAFSGAAPAKVKILLPVGACLVLAGLAGLTFTMPAVNSGTGLPLLLMCGSLALTGIGVGIGWPHLLTRVLTAAIAGEEEKAAASITTVQLLATAFGTALTGLVANASGLIAPGGITGAQQAAGWLLGLFIITPALALLLQLKQRRLP
ncbi:MFS transporter [Chitinophaga nivalis]|uniref:MFS transporter n=1 Tax=Chitinophaga nivalis TaxID=2991709 RepID=A0ABT3ILZ0_9BACT|nr:MFS transporter [Chitinophaga nivalis]MCW3465326.1 MFS transporter [Chitinophaga nivalis]MCW3484982.1 MFS transporter [Chitinophaga nivalis]